MEYNTIIIGSGMSGMTAALYLKRANMNVMILEKSAPGGQLLRTSTVENYPAVSKIEGAQLALNLYEQINNLKIPVNFEEVVKIENKDDMKIVHTKQNSYFAKNIVIATGRMYKKLDVENEDELTGKGISYCAICDGALYKNKNVAVIGAGNSAFEEALYLSNLCAHVTLITRRDEFRADSSLIDGVKNKDNITIISEKAVEKFVGDEKLDKVVIKDKITDELEELEVDGCFIYIGQEAETAIFNDLGIKMSNGYIITGENMQTSISNIYACGDCRIKDVYQLVTASYDGVIAASEIIKQN